MLSSTRLATLLATVRTHNANDPVGGGLHGLLHPANRVTADLAAFISLDFSDGVHPWTVVSVFTPFEAVGVLLLLFK